MPVRSKKSITIETLKEIELLSLGVLDITDAHDEVTIRLLRRIDYLIDLLIEERGHAALKYKLDSLERLI